MMQYAVHLRALDQMKRFSFFTTVPKCFVGPTIQTVCLCFTTLFVVPFHALLSNLGSDETVATCC